MKLTDKRFWIFESIVLICTIICIFILWMKHWLVLFGLASFGFCCLMLNHLHFHIMDETLVGAVWFSILWILLPYAFWRSSVMETI